MSRPVPRDAGPAAASSSPETLVLVCPGLLGPIPAPPEPAIQAPSIARLLARADRTPLDHPDPVAAVLSDLGLGVAEDRDPPSGAICLLGEGYAVAPDEIWMHADPVHLRPDRDRLLVYAGPGIEPDRAEAEALLESFNRHFAEDGLRLVAPTPGRWYLRLERPLDVRGCPLSRARYRSMAEYLPSGPAARDWMRLLNEAQMLFHAHPVNRRRESTRRPTISGIWTWGGGSMPSVPGPPPDALVGDHPLMLGLARLLARPHRALGDWLAAPAATQGQALVFWDRHWRALLDRDLATWSLAWTELEAAVGILEERLRAGRLEQALVDPCHGGAVFSVSARQSRRFWRRSGLDSHLSVGPSD
ncbi:phosphoglycerate mutase [Thiocystis violacea]|uniref:phosphoglycerate mutase n=1 Tax=Thiocystis violacea TaxID=13725 RepID=UPI001904CADB|nr:phosphoglycerate mutase [Thiocystis violacea]MBK1717918.1 hypothetical protein [Thiocystis violacea]